MFPITCHLKRLTDNVKIPWIVFVLLFRFFCYDRNSEETRNEIEGGKLLQNVLKS